LSIKPKNVRANHADFYPVSSELSALGWKTPNTYDSHTYKQIPASPGLYLFLYDDIDRRKDTCKPEAVLYVGMSRNLAKRQIGHEVYREIITGLQAKHGNFFYCGRWFKEVRTEELRAAERTLILKYNPPYNIIGRKRGMA
jgi:hypothetical protein